MLRNQTNSNRTPSKEDIKQLILLFNQRRYAEGEAASRTLIEKFPNYALGWKLLGACLKQQGLNAAAAEAMRRAVELQPDDPEAHSNFGATLKSLGRLAESEASLRRALQLKPDYVGALNNLANTLKSQGRMSDAEASYRQALELAPASAELYFNLGKLFQDQRRFGDSEAMYRRALAIKPDYADAHTNLGNTFVDQRRFAEAEASYRRVIELRPDSTEAHNNMGGLLKLVGRLTESEVSLHRALELNPNYAEAHNNLGNTFNDEHRLSDAEASYRKALELKPDYAEAHNNLGNTLKDLGRLAEAEACCRRAIQLRPDYVEAHNNLGTILQDQGRLFEAEASLRRALAIKPDHADIHYNLGYVANAVGRLSDAEGSYRQALAINPYSAEAYNNLGNVLKDQGRLVEAEASLRRALEIKPDYVDAHSNLLFTGNYSACGDPQYYLEQARAYGRLVAGKVTERFVSWRCVLAPERLRIGLVSGDLNRHPVGHFLESLLGQIDGQRVELIAYPTRSTEDDLTARVKPHFGAWRPVAGLSDEAATRLIHADGVHVLLDLSGHTAHNRLPVFAWKPAPVQASWLGYFATTGVAEIDYLIADPWTLPESEEAHFTETIWRLPETRLCFTAPDVNVAVSPLPASAHGYITFGCFNNLAKMNDAVVTAWARVLTAVPRSQLFLKAKQLNDATVRQRVVASFAAHGIDAQRLILEGPVPRAEYLATYRRVDIVLDPFPFPGGTTSVEALWMGVPVLSLTGDRFLSRQGAGLLMNAGLPEWIAANTDDYVARAVAHAQDLGRLATLRAGLRQQVLTSPIFDAPRFARHFEVAMWEMWQKRGLTPLRYKQCCLQCEATQAAGGRSGEASTALEIRKPMQTAIEDHQAGRLSQAEAIYRRVLEAEPDNPDALHLLGLIAHQAGKNKTAVELINKAITANPLNAAYYNNLGAAYAALNRVDEAIACYRKALSIEPDYADAYNNLGVALESQGERDEAIACVRQALLAKPNHAKAHNNLGVMLEGEGKRDEAIVCYRKALSIEPDYADAYNNLGVALKSQGERDEAIACFRQALLVKPNHATAHNNLGAMFEGESERDEAIVCFRKALSLKPDFAEAHNNLGNVFRDQGKRDEAIACYRKALLLQPDFAVAHHALIHMMNQAAEDDGATVFAQCRVFAEQFERGVDRLSHRNDPSPDRRIKVGYVSGDFRQHSVAYFIEPVLANHDDRAVEVFCYSNHRQIDHVTRRLMGHCGHWRSIVELSDDKVAALIQQDGIDILVDLSGHTNHNRLLVFARKPAPVQVTWIGLPNTTGLSAMDYRLTNRYIDPVGMNERYHTETLVRLSSSSCFQPEADLLPVNELPALTAGYITFSSFNNPQKLSPAVFVLWSRILAMLPGSRLMMICRAFSREHVQEGFLAHGVGAERLVFVDKLPVLDYLALHHKVDIALDTFPYNGGTITRNSLWMGVPVVTLVGRVAVARSGFARMSEVGLEEFVAQTEEDYVRIALRWGRDVEGLARVRRELRQRMEAAPSSNAEACTREVEAAYRHMWRTWCARSLSDPGSESGASLGSDKLLMQNRCGKALEE